MRQSRGERDELKFQSALLAGELVGLSSEMTVIGRFIGLEPTVHLRPGDSSSVPAQELLGKAVDAVREIRKMLPALVGWMSHATDSQARALRASGMLLEELGAECIPEEVIRLAEETAATSAARPFALELAKSQSTLSDAMEETKQAIRTDHGRGNLPL
jgi:hypothetical protein